MAHPTSRSSTRTFRWRAAAAAFLMFQPFPAHSLSVRTPSPTALVAPRRKVTPFGIPSASTFEEPVEKRPEATPIPREIDGTRGPLVDGLVDDGDPKGSGPRTIFGLLAMSLIIYGLVDDGLVLDENIPQDAKEVRVSLV